MSFPGEPSEQKIPGTNIPLSRAKEFALATLGQGATAFTGPRLHAFFDQFAPDPGEQATGMPSDYANSQGYTGQDAKFQASLDAENARQDELREMSPFAYDFGTGLAGAPLDIGAAMTGGLPAEAALNTIRGMGMARGGPEEMATTGGLLGAMTAGVPLVGRAAAPYVQKAAQPIVNKVAAAKQVAQKLLREPSTIMDPTKVRIDPEWNQLGKAYMDAPVEGTGGLSAEDLLKAAKASDKRVPGAVREAADYGAKWAENPDDPTRTIPIIAAEALPKTPPSVPVGARKTAGVVGGAPDFDKGQTMPAPPEEALKTIPLGRKTMPAPPEEALKTRAPGRKTMPAPPEDILTTKGTNPDVLSQEYMEQPLEFGGASADTLLRANRERDARLPGVVKEADDYFAKWMGEHEAEAERVRGIMAKERGRDPTENELAFRLRALRENVGGLAADAETQAPKPGRMRPSEIQAHLAKLKRK